MDGGGERLGRRKRERAPTFQGWLSTDAEEIKRREWRGRTEIDEVRRLDDRAGVFSEYEVTSSSGNCYTVEIRSRRERINSCGCYDFRTNRLGTCKHIEGVLRQLRRTRGGEPAGSRIEVFLDERGDRELRLSVPPQIARDAPGLERDVDEQVSGLRRGSADALAELRRIELANGASLRVSRRLEGWLSSINAETRRRSEFDRFMRSVESGERAFDLLKLPLLPYQIEGAAHLAFGERALLADDMGLGKTVQAIAASLLLRERKGIERVLVVTPASLKGEWDEQIKQFCDEAVTIVYGNKMARLASYGERSFFTLCNYEQVVADGREMLDALAPDIIILDEAQRIKNWQTKTASAVKKLRSRYAFVLTGTPIENRIDEIYSIVQFLDPEILGPLFRFNRDYYQLDERGRPVGFQNLDKLAERLSSVMLRRRKDDVETQLPDRMTKTFFVPMTERQRSVYDDYELATRRIAAIAQRRPLTADEFEKLQRCLACMRMVCDTPYILDDRYDDCPKLDELEKLLPELLEDPERKIIIFSEWVRMLELVRELASDSGLDVAWHTGSVPQHRRREEIRRFREDRSCRLFLSSESGGLGLNLQVADTVINLDLPWNPARLEQRISRAWRKQQTRSVNVIHLVSQDTIEQRMLGLLAEKQALAEGVLDGRGDLSEIQLPTGRNAFMDRLNEVLKTKAAPADPPERGPDRVLDELLRRFGAALQRVLVRGEADMLAVIDLPPDRIGGYVCPSATASGIDLSTIDTGSYESMLRLAKSGFVSLPTDGMRQIHPAEGEAQHNSGRIQRSRALADQAERKLLAAQLLVGGGFDEEARDTAVEAVRLGAGSLAALEGRPEPVDADEATTFLVEEADDGGVFDAIRLLSRDGGQTDMVGAMQAFLSGVVKRIADVAEPER